MAALGWAVLALVFVDELLAVAALAWWGWELGGAGGPAAFATALGMAAVAVTVWATWASPRAPRGGPLARPVAKVLVFGAAALGLWLIGRPALAAALVGFSVTVNVAAMHPRVQALTG